MAIRNFVPIVWAEKLERASENLLVFAPLTNRKWQGTIKQRGDTVKIGILNSVSTFEYDGTEFVPEEPITTTVDLKIDRSPAFAVWVDDVDIAQANGVLDEVTAEGTEQLASEMDTQIATVIANGAGKRIAAASVTVENVRSYLQAAKKEIRKANYKGNDICAVVTPDFFEKLEQAVESLQTNNEVTEKNGFEGITSGIRIYQSNNIPQKVGKDQILVFTKRATGFAHQLEQIEAVRPSKAFKDLVKGLSLFGAAVVRPAEIVAIDVGVYA